MDFNLTEEQQILRESVRKFLEKEIKPEPFGYMDGTDDLITAALLSEELARVFPALEGIMTANLVCARYIQQAGSQELKERAIPALLSGEKFGCAAVTEPNVGSDPTALETRAVLEGDHYVINGSKCWISNGEISDYAVVLCHADMAEGRKGIATVLVERERSPYEARDLPKLGLKAWRTSELVFEDCRVPEENCLWRWGLPKQHSRRRSTTPDSAASSAS
jgi:alkylation response protein AidB-like acyl-CoA dehydrogenase